MRIFTLSKIGDNFASSPSNNPSDSLLVLYWMRRNQGKATDTQLMQFVVPRFETPNKWRFQKVIQGLKENGAINEVGRD